MIKGAFNIQAIEDDIFGVLITSFQRGIFSNEAGIGSIPIEHSAAKTNIPIRESFITLLKPFIDTVVICTMTALIFIFTGVYNTGEEGLTSQAFASVIGCFPYVLAVPAYSSMISWPYCGQKGFNFF